MVDRQLKITKRGLKIVTILAIVVPPVLMIYVEYVKFMAGKPTLPPGIVLDLILKGWIIAFINVGFVVTVWLTLKVRRRFNL